MKTTKGILSGKTRLSSSQFYPGQEKLKFKLMCSLLELLNPVDAQRHSFFHGILTITLF